MNGAVELLSNLVAIQSLSGGEEHACAFLADALPAAGWERVEIDGAGSVVASRGSGSRELVLMGHIDTVPGGPAHMLDGDILRGRGSVDAKGPLCAFAVAGGRAPIAPDWKITLVAATGEEADSRGALHRLPKHSPAACIIGEPSGADGVTIGYRGSLRIALSASDGGAHRSGDAGPVTAVVRATADILSFVESVDSPELPVIQRPSGAVVSMHGEENGRRLGRSDLDIRLPEGSDPQQWIEHVMELAGRRGVNARVLAVTPAHVADKNNTAARALRLAVRKNGLNPRLLAKGGTADFNLAAAWNCPMAAYGPGDSKLDHTAEEHISLSEYLTSLDILTDAIPAIMRSA